MVSTTARYTYMDCYKPDGDNTAQLYQGLNTLARLDYKTGNVEYFSPGPSCLVQEPCFSPRHPDAEEGDGFLITMIDNQRLNRNEVVRCSQKLHHVSHLIHPHLLQIIQDTKDFQSVIAKIILPFRKCITKIQLVLYAKPTQDSGLPFTVIGSMLSGFLRRSRLRFNEFLIFIRMSRLSR